MLWMQKKLKIALKTLTLERFQGRQLGACCRRRLFAFLPQTFLKRRKEV